MTAPDCTPDLTPIERWGEAWVKRDDLYVFAGQAGGKVRTCLALTLAAVREAERFGRPRPGLVTASARTSPQQLIVASIGARLGLPVRLHVPASKEASDTLVASVTKGAEVVEHRPGYNSVITSRARADAAALGWAYIPFGMECEEAVRQTAGQVASLYSDRTMAGDWPQRIAMPVGSGMSLAGVLTGLERAGCELPVLGVVVGADPTRRLDRYAPPFWRQMVELVPAGMDYHTAATMTGWWGLETDPYYEAKALPFTRPGDLLWIVGNRVPQPSRMR